MSATAQVRRYSEYVQPLCDHGSGRAGQYAIGDGATVYNTTRRYLKDAIAEAGYAESAPPVDCFELGRSKGRAALEPLCELMARLAIQLVARTIADDEHGGTILIFAPTYAMIERVHNMLERGFPTASLPEGVPLYVLHSSVDIEDSMAALRGEDGASARIVIASAVAESSITIKQVTHVIDSCRACEVRWEAATGEASAHIVWVSQAQAKQRAGRTGRTNDGTVWMLVLKEWYHSFAEFEQAALCLTLLRKECLLLTCAQPKQVCRGPCQRVPLDPLGGDALVLTSFPHRFPLAAERRAHSACEHFGPPRCRHSERRGTVSSGPSAPRTPTAWDAPCWRQESPLAAHSARPSCGRAASRDRVRQARVARRSVRTARRSCRTRRDPQPATHAAQARAEQTARVRGPHRTVRSEAEFSRECLLQGR